MKLPMLEKDKANHVIYGSLIAFVASVAAMLVFSKALAVVIGAITSVVFSALKELSDYVSARKAEEVGLKPPHTPDVIDFLYGVAGAVFVSIVYRAFA